MARPTNKKLQHIELLSKLGGVNLMERSRYNALVLNEKNGHRLNEQYCNGEITEEFYDKWRDRIKMSVLKKLPNLKNALVFNGDPRGYFLKLDANYVFENSIPITRDFGGYGIICPEEF